MLNLSCIIYSSGYQRETFPVSRLSLYKKKIKKKGRKQVIISKSLYFVLTY